MFEFYYQIMIKSSTKHLLKASKLLLIDGGLATHLETGYKCNLNNDLWSTKALEEDKAVIESAHKDFLIAGASAVITCTY